MDIRISGKRIRRSLKTDEYGLALEHARDIQLTLIQRAQKKDITFADFKKKYLEWAWSSKPTSADREEQRLARIESFFNQLGIQSLSKITPFHIEQLRAKLKEVGRSKSTINRYCQLLRGMFYRAKDWEMYEGENPLKKIKFYRETPEIRLLSKEEVEKIIVIAQEIGILNKSPLQKVFPDLILFALNTGMRKSEILNLRWHDIRADKVEVKGKGERKRTIPLNAIVQEILGNQPRRGDYVFYIPNRDLAGLFRRTIDLISKRAGIDFHFHLFRHYFASRLLEQGIDIVTISELLGHRQVPTSLIYSHTDFGRKRHAVDSL